MMILLYHHPIKLIVTIWTKTKIKNWKHVGHEKGTLDFIEDLLTIIQEYTRTPRTTKIL